MKIVGEELELAEMAANDGHAFKGVWLPKLLWESKEISWQDKCLIATIDSLDNGQGCFASNGFLAKRFGISEGRMANKLTELRDKGFLVTVKFDGRKRWIRSTFPSDGVKADLTETVNPALTETVKADLTETVNIEQSLEQSLENTTVVVFGKPEINELFDYWKTATGIGLTEKTQANRRACHNLLKKHGADNVKRLIDGVALAQGDKFAPRISDFSDLQSKMNAFLLWGKQRKSSNQVVVIS